MRPHDPSLILAFYCEFLCVDVIAQHRYNQHIVAFTGSLIYYQTKQIKLLSPQAINSIHIGKQPPLAAAIKFQADDGIGQTFEEIQKEGQKTDYLRRPNFPPARSTNLDIQVN